MEEFGKSNPRLAPVLYITAVYLYERCIREINAGFYSSQSLALEKFIEKISSAFVVRFFLNFRLGAMCCLASIHLLLYEGEEICGL